VPPWAVAGAAVSPWLWFVGRDLDGRLDAVALGLPVLVGAVAAALASAALVTRRLPPALAALSWLVVGVIAVVGPWRPIPGGSPAVGLRIVGANVLADRSGGRVVDDILDERPDLVVVAELGDLVDARLRDAYPSAAVSPILPGQFVGDVGVYSRYPMDAGPLPGGLADQHGMRVVVDGPAGELVVYALHLAKPAFRPTAPVEVGFRSHRRLVDRLRAAVRAEELPTVVVGDLNLVDRSSGYRALAGDLDDAMRAGWVGPTSHRFWTSPLLARVDHVFVPESWCAEDARTFSLTASDHRGVATTVGPC